MIFKKIATALLLPALVLPVWAEQIPAGRQQQVLRRLEKLALETNLGFRAAQYDLRAGQAAYDAAKGIYDPRLAFEYAEGKDRDPLNATSSVLFSKSRSRLLDAGITTRVPTGADLSLDFVNLREDAFAAPRLNPSWRSSLKFGLAQPLLKGFGTTVTEQTILLAARDRALVMEDLRLEAQILVARVRDAWFELQRVRDNLQYRQTSLDLARQVLEENRRKVLAGTLAPVEELEAEVAVQERERELLEAELAHRNALGTLALELNLDAPPLEEEIALERPAFAADEQQGVEAALAKRPELLRQKEEIAKLGIRETLARNGTLPDLSLQGSYSRHGLGEDFDRDVRGIREGDYDSWSLGLKLSYPLGNREAASQLLRTRVLGKGARARAGQLEAEIRKQVREALRQLRIEDKKIDVTARGRELAEEKLRILLKRKELGLATTRQVFEGERDLAAARTEQMASLAGYNSAITAYLLATGQLLEQEGFSILEDVDAASEQSLVEFRP